MHLEFKQATYGTSDGDKKELLKDISSFANTLGGHLVIGVEEDNGTAIALSPLSGMDVDQELLRLENIARSGVEPPVLGLRMKRVAVTGGDVIAMHVPRSYNPPHRVIFRNSNRYYARNSAGAYEPSLEELRRLFGEQRTIEEQAQTFIEERLLRIQAGDAPMPIPVEKGVTVMHLVPLPDLGAGRRIEIPAMREQHLAFMPMGASGMSWRVNLDGFNLFRGGEVCNGYTQVFRDGSLEATSTSMIADRDGRRLLPSLAIPERFIQSLSSYIGGLRALEASPPVLLRISFTGMNGVRMGVDPMRVMDEPPSYEREELRLPHTVISEYRDDGNYEQVIAEQMDFLWNAFDFDRCFYFDEDGNWVGGH
ncbi:Putative DNA-binding domain-containing protein [Roseovarius pacificus]|uniref:Putative DNA-binding domain-containing protein n=1 Tax=Roseovarius pacificus TaxID=337701 RepID=A0A1M7IQF3_9RHOB|nr:ATP-binding protein [Roseovarius pacificus]GGO61440.1 hypothetical protein GCM10011315_38140 [Roseovarius pacificus]SHM43044.1 Putative DNA-binding domain-containing protein [Roseovarius pacificus]